MDAQRLGGEAKSAYDAVLENGLEPVAVRGAIQVGDGYANAYTESGRVFFRVDAVDSRGNAISPEMLVQHEMFHNYASEEVIRATDEVIRESMTAEEYDAMRDAYKADYAGVYDFANMSVDEIERLLTEEIAADAYAGLNWFSGDAPVQEAVRAETERNAPARRAEARQETTGPPEGRTAIEVARSNGDIQRNVLDYADKSARNAAQRTLHNRMVSEGKTLDLTENRESASQYFPDLRAMPKAERTSILREKIRTLKNDLRTYLNQLKGVNFEFEINGNTIEATIYNAGIKEVLQNLTQDKAGMLTASEEIFRNAEYLYSTQDKTGSSTITGWDYFYVPVKMGGDTVGVRIAVRNTVKPREAQIYNWGIKKGDTSLDGVGHLPKGSNSADVSSDASHNSTIRSSTANSQEKSSGKASVEVENRDSNNEKASSDNEKREPRYTVIDGKDAAGKESALADAYDKAVEQGKGMEISEVDLKKYQDIRDNPEQTLIEAVKKYYEESLKGTSVEVTANDGIVEIRFENDGKKKSVGWRMKADKAATFEKLHQLTENAEYAYSEANRNENERTSIPMFHYFVNNARIAGRDIPVKIQVRDVITSANSKETHYYTHTLEKNMRGNSGPVAGTQSANIDSNATAPSETNIRSTTGNSQEKFSGKASVEVENQNTAMSEEDARRERLRKLQEADRKEFDRLKKRDDTLHQINRENGRPMPNKGSGEVYRELMSKGKSEVLTPISMDNPRTLSFKITMDTNVLGVATATIMHNGHQIYKDTGPIKEYVARDAAQKALHDRMVSEGKTLDLTENRENASQYFPNLRSMPKAERTGLLREKIQTLKNDLRTYLNQLKGVNFEFEINGNTIEATVYNAGIKEVLQNLTQDKAGMLSASEEIFRNAEYLYSTQDKTGNSTVTGWDYFYVPVKLGGDAVGVRIAVRNTVKPREAQIYNWNWGIKREGTSLDGVGLMPGGRTSADVSSDVSSTATIRQTEGNSQEKSSGKASVEVNPDDTATQRLKERQFELIQNNHPKEDWDYQTWINSVDDVKTYQEAVDDDRAGTPDFDDADIDRALKTGRVRVYSSHRIRIGTFVLRAGRGRALRQARPAKQGRGQGARRRLRARSSAGARPLRDVPRAGRPAHPRARRSAKRGDARRMGI